MANRDQSLTAGTEDTALLERCRKGERKACFELYRLYAKAMFNISLRITNNHSWAEEALQEAFIRAFNNLHHYNPEHAFGAWLKKITVNCSLTQLRKYKNEKLFAEAPDIADEREAVQAVELSVEKIKHAVSLLADGYRLVLSLYLFEGYDHGEIAEILQISEETSRSARKKLAHILSGEGILLNRKQHGYER